jgi:hypothetical protein
MTVDNTGQQRFRIVDSNGNLHVVCCPVCALKLLSKYSDLTINSFCDYNGPDYPIVINAKNHGAELTVNPSTALIIVGGSCSKNRIVYDSAAADALLSPPNNGTSNWLSILTNDPVAINATRLTIAQAVTKFVVAGDPTPSPVTSSVPVLPTSTATITQKCEVCEMDVSPDSQSRYIVTDGNGGVHYVECFMCALNLANDYESLQIQTYCDWYGPNYKISVNSSNYGETVSVSPPTAIFLRGGSCVTARAAYNQTAADSLLNQGFSQYTSLEQQYTLPSSTQVKLVTEAINLWYAQPNTTNGPIPLTLILVGAIGVAVLALAIVGYWKLKNS